jgi:hypothetical protein
VQSPSVRVNSKEFGGISSAKRNIIGQSSGFEPGRMRNTSTTEKRRVGRRDRRHHETPTAYAVGIEAKSYAGTTGSRQWLDTSLWRFPDDEVRRHTEPFSRIHRRSFKPQQFGRTARAVLSAAVYSDDYVGGVSLLSIVSACRLTCERKRRSGLRSYCKTLRARPCRRYGRRKPQLLKAR